MALERRVMFDGAGAGDLAAAAEKLPTDASAQREAQTARPTVESALAAPAAGAALLRIPTSALDASPALARASVQAQGLLDDFLQRSDVREHLFALFNGGRTEGGAAWQQAADTLLAELRSGSYSIQVQLLTGVEMQGALGAFTARGPDGSAVIFVNADWLKQSPGISSISRVLLEELGHSLDARLNPNVDTAGDEGEAFAALASGMTLTTAESNRIATENDHALVVIDGKAYAVENAAPAITQRTENLTNNYNEVLSTTKGFTVTARNVSAGGVLSAESNALLYVRTNNGQGEVNGFGVTGGLGHDGAADEVGWNDQFGMSEQVILNLDNSVLSATVQFSWLGNTEQATYTLYLDGALVRSAVTVNGVTDVLDPAVTMTASNGSRFNKVIFQAAKSGSDFLINNITFPVASRITATEDTAKSINGLDTLSVTDSDNNLTSTSLSVTNGTLNLTLSGGASFSSGANGSASFIISGNQADINATLATLTYQGNLNFNGADTLTMVSTDATALSTTARVPITVTPVNDTPQAQGNTYTAAARITNGWSALMTSKNLITNTDSTSGTDSDPETATAALRISKINDVTFAANGTDANHLAANGWMQVALTEGMLFVKNDGTTEFSPTLDRHTADTFQTFTYAVTDGTVSSTNATVRVNIKFDPRPTVAVSNVTVNETSAYAVFQVSLDLESTTATTFTPTLASGNGTVGTDTGTALQYLNGGTWTNVTGVLSIAAGSTSMLLRTTIVDDAVFEGPETFTLSTGAITGTAVSNAVAGATGTGTIKDDGSSPNVFLVGNTTATPTAATADNDTPTISVSSVTVNEASPYAVFQVSLNKLSATATTFTPILASGTGTVGTDTGAALQYLNAGTWTDVTGALSIAAGSTSVLVRTAIVNDTTYEASETFTLSTGAITNTTVTNTAGATGTGTMKDDGTSTNVFLAGNLTATATSATADNDTPTVSVSSVNVSEASPYAVFQVSLSNASASAISFTPTLASGTATVGTDTGAIAALEYFNGTAWTTVAVNSSVTIAAGSTSALLRTAIVNNDIYEGPETFTLSTGAITGTVTSNGALTATGTIKDDGSSTNVFESGNNSATPTVGTADNDKPTVTVSSVTVSEASPYAVFQVSLNKASASAISFTPTLVDGTATVGTDIGASAALQYFNGTSWVSAAGGVTIAAGSTSMLLRTTIVNDDIYEGSDTFTLSTGAITGTVTNTGAATGIGTIKDDGSSTHVFEIGNNTATPTAGSPNDDSPKPPPPKADPSPIPPPVAAPVNTLPAQTTTTNLPVWVPEVIKPSALARTLEVPTLVMAERIPDQFAESNSVAVISVPDSTFMVSTPGQQLTLTAEQSNGTPLPAWLSFNSNTRRFEGQPPPNFVGELNLKVTARDGQGGEAEAQFRLQIGSSDSVTPDVSPTPISPISQSTPGTITGRTSLQQQLREMAQLRRGELTRINTARNSGPAPATRG